MLRLIKEAVEELNGSAPTLDLDALNNHLKDDQAIMGDSLFKKILGNHYLKDAVAEMDRPKQKIIFLGTPDTMHLPIMEILGDMADDIGQTPIVIDTSRCASTSMDVQMSPEFLRSLGAIVLESPAPLQIKPLLPYDNYESKLQKYEAKKARKAKKDRRWKM